MIVHELLGGLAAKLAAVGLGVAATAAARPDTGLARGRPTPAGARFPAFVPGPPSDRPAGPPAGTPGSRGTDTADQTPASAQRRR